MKTTYSEREYDEEIERLASDCEYPDFLYDQWSCYLGWDHSHSFLFSHLTKNRGHDGLCGCITQVKAETPNRGCPDQVVLEAIQSSSVPVEMKEFSRQFFHMTKEERIQSLQEFKRIQMLADERIRTPGEVEVCQ